MDGLTATVLGLFVAAVIFRLLTNKIIKEAEGKATSALIVKVKQCPPHQWFYQDITDEAGVHQGSRLVCKLCGPINTGGSSEG